MPFSWKSFGKVCPGNLQSGVPACPKRGVTVLFCETFDIYIYIHVLYIIVYIYIYTQHTYIIQIHYITLIRIISYADVFKVEQTPLNKGALKLWGMRWPASTSDSYESRWTKSWKLSYRLVVDMINHMYFISMTVYVPYTDPTLPQLWIDPARREKELLTGLLLLVQVPGFTWRPVMLHPKILLDAMLWCGHFVSKIELSGCCFLYSNPTSKNGGHTTHVADRTDGHQATGRSFIGNSSDR